MSRSPRGGPIPALAARSVEVILENQSETGAYVASPSLPAYRFSWFRDGAFIADAMSRAGEGGSAEAFFGWCSAVVSARRGRIEELVRRHRAGEAVDPSEHLHCRYTVDGHEFEGEWANYQLDGYGLWLWALGAHAERSGASLAPYAEAAAASIRYVGAFWGEPCYDWWEERWGRHTTTLASIYAGLAAATTWERLPVAVRDEAASAARALTDAVGSDALHSDRLGAEVGDSRLDASILACATPLRLVSPDDSRLAATVRDLEAEIAHLGVHRYPGDTYYGGGEWLLLAALLGWWYAEVGREDDAWAQLDWVAAQASASGDLPEQVATHVFDEGALARWERRLGPSPSPLLWSHAMFLTLALELGLDPPTAA